VTLKSVGAQHVASIRRSIACYADAVELFAELDTCTKRGHRGAPPAAMWHTCGSLGRPIDCEAYVPIRHAFSADGRITVYDIPPTLMASIVCRGSSSTSADAYVTIRSWIASHSFKISGPKRELYWRGGPDDDRETDITEIQFPVALRTSAPAAHPR
jgi:effector-binding domain-containing protein